MNIVKSGERLTIYGEGMETFKKLPARTYQVGFSPLSGFYLMVHNDLAVKGKVYGPYQKKVDKTLLTFKKGNRNMGIMLVGPKGVGKSLFARLLAQKGREENLPLIIVSEFIPGIADFISSIKQECIVLFDEFEKTFRGASDGVDKQETLLPLLDGIDNGKRLFVITCNEINDVNTYFRSRPGRIRYSFKINPPSATEIREFMEDNLIDDAKTHINDVVAIGYATGFTYDVLTAIAEELNQGYDLTETLNDLNVENSDKAKLTMTMVFKNGKTESGRLIYPYDGDNEEHFEIRQSHKLPIELYRKVGSLQCEFNKQDIKISPQGQHYIEPADIRLYWEYCEEYGVDENILTETEKRTLEGFNLQSVELTKVETRDILKLTF